MAVHWHSLSEHFTAKKKTKQNILTYITRRKEKSQKKKKKKNTRRGKQSRKRESPGTPLKPATLRPNPVRYVYPHAFNSLFLKP